MHRSLRPTTFYSERTGFPLGGALVLHTQLKERAVPSSLESTEDSDGEPKARRSGQPFVRVPPRDIDYRPLAGRDGRISSLMMPPPRDPRVAPARKPWVLYI